MTVEKIREEKRNIGKGNRKRKCKIQKCLKL